MSTIKTRSSTIRPTQTASDGRRPLQIPNPNLQAPVVQKVDSAIHWITLLVLIVFIRWIVICPLDSAIHLETGN